MTRSASTDQLRVDPPPVPVDAAFVAVLAAQAAVSRPTFATHRTRSRLTVTLVAAAVAATTLTGAWAARELATRPPAPATHERRVEPVPDLPPSPSRTRHAVVEETADDPGPTEEPRTARRHNGARTTPADDAAAAPGRAAQTAPAIRPHHDADEPDGHGSGGDQTDNPTDDPTGPADEPTDGPTDGPTDDPTGPSDDHTDGGSGQDDGSPDAPSGGGTDGGPDGGRGGRAGTDGGRGGTDGMTGTDLVTTGD